MLKFLRSLMLVCRDKHISSSAAALSYYMTLAIFPSIICLYAVLENALPDAELLSEMLGWLVPESAIKTALSYLEYISVNGVSTALLTAGLTLMLSTSAAAVRAFCAIMKDIRNGSRLSRAAVFVMSWFFGPVVLAAVYLFAVFTALSGMEWVMDFAYGTKIAGFVLMPAAVISASAAAYKITAPKSRGRAVFPGAVFSGISVAALSAIFSVFIEMSSRYPLVYGSLAAVAVMMLWLHLCAEAFIIGGIVNELLEEGEYRAFKGRRIKCQKKLQNRKGHMK